MRSALKLVICFICLSACISAFGNIVCNTLLTPRNVKIMVLDHFDVSETQVNQIAKAIRDADEFLTGLILPENLLVKVSNSDLTDNRHLQGCSEIHTNFSSFSTENERLGVLIHEYGHGIVEKNFKDAIPGYGAYLKSAKRYRKIQRQIRSLSKTKDAFKIKTLEAAELVLENQLRPYFDNARILIFYEELFADVLTVSTFNDPSLMAKATKEPERDFLGKWDRVAKWTKTDQHDVLSPARSFLWDNYLNRGPVFTKNNQILQRLLSEIEKSYLELVPYGFTSPVKRGGDIKWPIPGETPHSLNTKLIHRLKSHLKI